MLAYLFKVRTKNRFHVCQGQPNDGKAQRCLNQRKIFMDYTRVDSARRLAFSAVNN